MCIHGLLPSPVLGNCTQHVRLGGQPSNHVFSVGFPWDCATLRTHLGDTAQRLSTAADRSLPPEQEKVASAEGAPIGQKDPVEGLLERVPGAYASELDRSAVRTLRREHGRAASIRLWSAPGGSRIFSDRTPRRFSLPGRTLFSSGPCVRARLHLRFAKGHGGGLLALVPTLQQCSAH